LSTGWGGVMALCAHAPPDAKAMMTAENTVLSIDQSDLFFFIDFLPAQTFNCV